MAPSPHAIPLVSSSRNETSPWAAGQLANALVKRSQEKEVGRGREFWDSTLFGSPFLKGCQQERKGNSMSSRSGSLPFLFFLPGSPRPCCPVPGSPGVGHKAGSIRTWFREDNRVLFRVFPILVGCGRSMGWLVATCEILGQPVSILVLCNYCEMLCAILAMLHGYRRTRWWASFARVWA